MLTLKDPTLLKNSCLVNGQWVQAASGGTTDVTNPADGTIVGTVPSMSPDEIPAVIAASQLAQAKWAAWAAKDRSTVLRKWFELIVENTEDLGLIMTLEQGKPISEAKGEIAYAASFIEWFAEEAKRVYGDTIPAPKVNQRLTVLRQPIGVTAAITPWNFPAAMITRKAAPALAAGCSMIVRPADLTPLTALALGELAQRAGIPAGVFQIVTGPASKIGKVITDSDVVRKLSFTGSTEVGRLLMAQCADTIKKVSLELGGNAPFIVFDDADLDAAVEGAMVSKYRNAGQTCVCANRILVQSGVYEAFTEKLAAKVKALNVGNGTEASTDIGPMIEAKALDKVESHIEDAVSKGATLVQGGTRLGGLFFEPAILTGVTPDMKVATEETFGPLAPLFSFDTEEDAVAMANDTIFGLAAYFYTKDHARMIRVSEALEYGMVGHNTGLISNEVAPFGGVKQSGLGREGSKFGIDEYLELKYICSAI
ncbi:MULTISPECIES: NAD-dependent succinate-semialdehyde dehydrogenase [Pacificibacter]|uniref:NAD-dependent succinate-semialdehyde dehydrogenase n=1 Tax=Pacificibacter TaxID=1042323 RepID=UPI001C0A3E52|nr:MULTISPECIES: NAD-dependent succinate-semialdehyde dehydrogenase [Pacificibacter]MBU2937593.1 NAD-dependent succinate-semialdehyde dehydrogenase [Pacificibacter marinus]MDO6616888.1 NAD-dependent succinate-semialdehyde dehydrogenase [Pacificibacter sp. 1_MG-2023]